MTTKRKRRVGQTTEGLAAGERLKRHKLATSISDSPWGWVGTEVLDASEISLKHRLATCSFARVPIFCPNKYSSRPPKPESQDTQEDVERSARGGDDVIVISDDEAPHCNKKLCRKNPNCVNYAGQEKWENRTTALKQYTAAANLGRDPSLDNRQSGLPVGLKNLGATCYANAYIQVWFQDLAFRNGVYHCQPSQDKEHSFEDSPIFQLQATFAALQAGKQRVFNPLKLVESLKLRTNEQQDAQEFSKLFMSHLDTEFQKQANPVLKNLLSRQFEGSQAYATVCQACGNRSERDSDFLEIEINLENNATLESRLQAVLQPEMLSGDNKYRCPRCETLEDATRQLLLRKLPPVLHFSLLRFVFDISTMERKKSKHAVAYPLVLDMNRFLADPPSDENENIYDLQGVLLHKGPSAYHGHYEARVFDVTNNAWFQFNDEVVTRVKPPGANGASDKDKAKGSQTAKGKANARKVQRIEDSDDDIIEVSPSTSEVKSAPSQSSSYITSKEAYMLIYARRSANTRRETPVPPPRALDAVRRMNETHERSCAAYIEREEAMQTRFDSLRERMMHLYQSWHLTSNDEKSIVTSQEALELFLSRPLGGRSEKSSEVEDTKTNDEGSTTPSKEKPALNGSATHQPGDISIEGIICAHGRLDPRKSDDMKRINYTIYESILHQEGCRFIPEMSPEDVCDECVREIFTEKFYQYVHPKQVEQLEDILTGTDISDSESYWISKQWLRDWRLNKPKMHTELEADPPPDSDTCSGHVMCEHGCLSLNTTARQRIPQEAYLLLKGLFPSWETLPEGAEHCAVCEAAIQISREDKRGVRKAVETEKARLKHMHDNALVGNTALLENVPCALVPATFVRSWRQWILRPGEHTRPDRLDNTPFLCPHDMLNIDPNSDLDTSVCLVRGEDWKTLEELYDAKPLIQVINRPNPDAEDGSNFSFQHPTPVCHECRWQRKANFDTTEVTVHVLMASEPDPTPETYGSCHKPSQGLQQTTLVTYAGARKSKRLRQAKQRKDKRLCISKDMSVKDIKLLIQEHLDVPTICQRLFLRGKELQENEATVAQLEMVENDFVDLRQENEDVDLLEDTDVDEPKAKRRAEGRAFGGTLLGGGGRGSSVPPTSSLEDSTSEGTSTPLEFTLACPACTLENPITATVCTICDTPLVYI